MTTLSIARSQKSRRPSIRQTKSQAVFEPEESPEDRPTSQWYELKYKQQNINALPSSIPISKHSSPFRLTIEKVHSIPQKKSTSSIQYLKLMVTLFTDEGEPVGKTAHYQCQTPVSSTDNAYDKQVCFYYHSRVDKSNGQVKMLIRFVVEELRDGTVESVHVLGIGVIKNPFSEEEAKNSLTFKQCTEVELATGIIQNPEKATLLFNYTIQSNLELKNIVKFIPSECIVSSQDHISGILGEYLPEFKDQSIEEQQIVFVNVKQCQIHIPDKFEVQVLECLRLVLPGEKIEVNQLTRRRVVCGFHNEYQYVMPASRNLEFLGKEATGQYTVQIFEVLGDNQTLKLPYYIPEKGGPNLCALAVSLVYTYSQVDYEVALFAFTPILDGPSEELSLTMVTGGGMGFQTGLLPVKPSGKTPTIILQYVSEARAYTKDRLESQSSISRKQRSKKQIMQSQKILEELGRERLSLQRQKQSLEMMKSQNYVNYQEDFERKLSEERENLRLRQEMIENQYREEVEKEIRAKMDLENQIRLMKERIAIIQEEQKSGMPSKKISYDQSPATQFDPGYAPSFNANYLPYARQKVNPNYLLDQQKTIPLNEVRDIVQKTFQKNNQLIQRQLKNFNFASKFTFSFNSVIWLNSVQPPKSFYLKIKFFNFPEFTSDPITYIQSSSQYNQLIRLNHYTYNIENSTPTYEFTVDPSLLTSAEQIHEDLVNFLAQNNTIIDIFDAENYLYIGQINIKMNDLFRGSKTQTMIAKEFNLVRVKCQQNYGVLQVLVRNQMADCKQEVSLQDGKFRREAARKKVVSNNPILLTKQIFDNEKSTEIHMLGSKNQSRNRQEKRIQMFKKRTTESKRKGTFDEIENHEKGRVIQKISEYKQKKMPEYIKKIYEDLLTQTITINPYFGQTKTFLYQFTNMSQVPSSFRVSFQGNDEGQLSLVKNPTEWKHFVTMNRFPSPKLYDCINEENSFYLAAGETIPLLFKYLSFLSATQAQRSCTVTVTKQENNWIIGGFSLIIQPHESITNHSYILYQPGNQTIDILLPVIFSSNDTRIPKYLFLTIEDAAAEWVHEYEIMLRVKTHQIMSFMRFHLLLYQDEYFCKLRENWTIEMYIYEGVYAVAKPDQMTKFKISLPESALASSKPSRIEFYSNCTDLVFEDEVIEGARLARGSVEVWCQLLPTSSNLGSVQITCVSEKKQLVYGWVVQVYPYSVKMS